MLLNYLPETGVERPTRSVHRESYRPQGGRCSPEAWYSIVIILKQMATLYVERKPKRRVRYGQEPGGSAGVVRAWHV